MNYCDKQCCKVGAEWHKYECEHENEEDFETDEEDSDYPVVDCDSYHAIISGEFGDLNYALAAYCVTVNHVECLQKLHQAKQIVWHDDLAVVAIEADHLECLRYVVEKMGDVTIKLFLPLGPNCREYVQKLTNGIYPHEVDKVR